jgi:hypothetical protein
MFTLPCALNILSPMQVKNKPCDGDSEHVDSWLTGLYGCEHLYIYSHPVVNTYIYIVG